MSARRKRVISTEEIQFNLKPAKMLLTKKKGESAKMAKPQIHGSHTFSKMKFQDFSKTYQGQNYIFQALSNSYLVYCKRVFVRWNILPYI